MQRLFALAPLLVAGCSSGVGSTGSQPTTEVDANSTGLKAAIYTGTIHCDVTTIVVVGDIRDESSDNPKRTVIINDSGLPVVDGQEVAPGLVITQELGGLSTSGSVTNVTPSDNGVVVDTDVETQFELCVNTCDLAFDGNCDDGRPGSDTAECNSFTDCSDCGAETFELRGLVRTTYKLFGVDRILYLRSAMVEDGLGTFRLEECQGILVP